ncbi:MAG: hypothetical protein P0Y49_07200 [Candidatus Pedobacter colombiensis]|uniref:Uncharacterized protein n=1 Tax=Candidatus Pedobacter colombiensis TaxID=3121371 RepID=A0AAJ5WE12_9SPHI|nr:hypothetical protein [Pedobacter sp.]WEK20922.1 MAG: hypothetical protein P0Y49_07200 [Pedobacter sp.]
MNTQLTLLRTLVLKELDPAYFNMDEQRITYWLIEIPLLKEQVFKSMQDEMLGNLDNRLLERHLKQVQYDCIYLMEVLCKYTELPVMAVALYKLAEQCFEQILVHIETRYSGFFNLQNEDLTRKSNCESGSRIRVRFSVDVLAYLFKLLNKAGGLDAGPAAHLMVSLSKNFTTRGIGEGYISVNGLTTRYKQVVQTTAQTTRKLLLKMLKCLDEEFDLG